MWSATVGATPVYRWTSAASAIFSCGVRGTPFWAKTLNRVPEFPKAHDGSSIRWFLSAASTAGLLVTSASVAPLSAPCGEGGRPRNWIRAISVDGDRSEPTPSRGPEERAPVQRRFGATPGGGRTAGQGRIRAASAGS